ncbi:MAG: sigma-54-dependent Fis family transcriptional regulator [SAR324 cluster bacterium]|nr:sigma-54-dependent Fis family transcriptional regulator [SAR324 cluster bacterium]MBF0350453.1 sigma-54-dependent Fis family transcriptional regulator [SAR324 cluster bacterium]
MVEPMKIIVVDDEKISRIATMQQLRDEGFISEAVDNGFKVLELLEKDPWDIVVSDIRMPNIDGLELLQKIKEGYPEVDVILITAFGTVGTAVKAMQDGAADFLTKPFRYEELSIRIKKLQEIRSTRREVTELRAVLKESQTFCGLIGDSPQMKNVYERIQTFAHNMVPVLITGRTGTGKEMVSRALHQKSGRGDHPFVAVACGAIPKELAESELFGHEKGSFTGALQKRKGSFERASGGTILLDDVDDLPMDIQVKLLRVLQEGYIQRVGGVEEIPVDVRVIATTKRDLGEAVKEGVFREDVFYRLRGLEIRLPPLKDRGNDVLILAQNFLHVLASRDKLPTKTMPPETCDIMKKYAWPGNVRELRRAMETAFVLSNGPEILPDHLPEYLHDIHKENHVGASLFTLHLENCEEIVFKEMIQQFEDTLIDWGLTKAGGVQSQAADLLNLPRTTFQSKIIGRNKKD